MFSGLTLLMLSVVMMNDDDYKVGGNDEITYNDDGDDGNDGGDNNDYDEDSDSDGDDGNDGGDDGDNDDRDDGNVHRRSGQTAAHTLSSVRARINTFSSTSRLR